MGGGINKKLKGVGGWLLVFVIPWAIGTIWNIFNVVEGISILSVYSIKDIGTSLILIFLYIVLTSILIFLKIVCLILIFKKKQKAIDWVIVTIVYGVLNAIFLGYFIVTLSKWILSVSMNLVFGIIIGLAFYLLGY